MTFHPSHVLPWVWQEVKVEAFSVNEADYFAGSRARGRREDIELVWLCGVCVAPPILEMRLAVAWAQWLC